MEYQIELSILKNTVDLAAAKSSKLSQPKKDSIHIEWLPFHLITQAFEEICHQLKVSKHMENRCYQLLLLMSAESEKHLTWWEKIDQLSQYIYKLDSKLKKTQLSGSSSNNRSKYFSSPDYYPKHDYLNSRLIRVTNEGRSETLPKKYASGTSPSILHEGTELSVLLNRKGNAQSSSNTRYESPLRASSLFDKEEINESTLDRSNYNQTPDPDWPMESNDTHLNLETKSSSNTIQDDNTLTDSKKTNYSLAYLKYRNSIYSPVQQLDDSNLADTIKTGIPSPQLSPSNDTRNNNRMNFQNKSSSTLFQEEKLDENKLVEPPIVVPDPESKSPLKSRSRSSVDYSNNLRNSLVMMKYTSGGIQSNFQDNYSTKSENPSSIERNNTNNANNTKNNSKSSVRTPTTPIVSTPNYFENKPTPLEKLFENVQSTKNESPSSNKSSANSSPTGKSKSLRNHRPSFTRSMGSKSPAVIRSSHFSSDDEEENDKFNPKNSYNTSPHTPNDYSFRSPYDNTNTSMQRSGKHYSLIENISIDPKYLTYEENLGESAKSSMKIFLFFQKWSLNQLESSQQQQHVINMMPILFYNHLSTLSDFVSDLFGLEQWLREQFKVFSRYQSLKVMFKQWSLYSGVSCQSRAYHRKYLIRRGYEQWMEFNIKSRLRKKNYIHAYIWRKRSYNQSNLTSTNIAKRKSLFFSENTFNSDQDINKLFPSDNSISSSSIKTNPLFSTMTNLRNLLHYNQFIQRNYKSGSGSNGTNTGRSSSTLDLGLNSYQIGFIKHMDYVKTQDLIALFHHFKRFYHRTIYYKRFDQVNKKHLQLLKYNLLKKWGQQYEFVCEIDRSKLTSIYNFQKKYSFSRMKKGFLRFQNGLYCQKQHQKYFNYLKEQYYSHPKSVQSLYLLIRPTFTRCFYRWKELFQNDGISQNSKTTAKVFLQHHRSTQALRQWKLFVENNQNQRQHSYNKQILLTKQYQPLLSMMSQYRQFASPLTYAATSAHGCVSKLKVKRQLDLQQQHRALLIWKKFALKPRFFSSLLELKFATSLSHQYANLLSLDRLKYRKLTLQFSTTTLPRSTSLYDTRNYSSDVIDASTFDENDLDNYSSNQDHPRREFYLLSYNKLYHQYTSYQRLFSGNEKNTRSSLHSLHSPWKILQFPMDVLESSPLFQDDQFGYLANNHDFHRESSTNDSISSSKGNVMKSSPLPTTFSSPPIKSIVFTLPTQSVRFVYSFIPLAGRRLLQLYDTPKTSYSYPALKQNTASIGETLQSFDMKLQSQANSPMIKYALSGLLMLRFHHWMRFTYISKLIRSFHQQNVKEIKKNRLVQFFKAWKTTFQSVHLHRHMKSQCFINRLKQFNQCRYTFQLEKHNKAQFFHIKSSFKHLQTKIAMLQRSNFLYEYQNLLSKYLLSNRLLTRTLINCIQTSRFTWITSRLQQHFIDYPLLTIPIFHSTGETPMNVRIIYLNTMNQTSYTLPVTTSLHNYIQLTYDFCNVFLPKYLSYQRSFFKWQQYQRYQSYQRLRMSHFCKKDKYEALQTWRKYTLQRQRVKAIHNRRMCSYLKIWKQNYIYLHHRRKVLSYSYKQWRQVFLYRVYTRTWYQVWKNKIIHAWEHWKLLTNTLRRQYYQCLEYYKEDMMKKKCFSVWKQLKDMIVYHRKFHQLKTIRFLQTNFIPKIHQNYQNNILSCHFHLKYQWNKIFSWLDSHGRQSNNKQLADLYYLHSLLIIGFKRLMALVTSASKYKKRLQRMKQRIQAGIILWKQSQPHQDRILKPYRIKEKLHVPQDNIDELLFSNKKSKGDSTKQGLFASSVNSSAMKIIKKTPSEEAEDLLRNKKVSENELKYQKIRSMSSIFTNSVNQNTRLSKTDSVLLSQAKKSLNKLTIQVDDDEDEDEVQQYYTEDSMRNYSNSNKLSSMKESIPSRRPPVISPPKTFPTYKSQSKPTSPRVTPSMIQPPKSTLSMNSRELSDNEQYYSDNFYENDDNNNEEDLHYFSSPSISPSNKYQSRSKSSISKNIPSSQAIISPRAKGTSQKLPSSTKQSLKAKSPAYLTSLDQPTTFTNKSTLNARFQLDRLNESLHSTSPFPASRLIKSKGTFSKSQLLSNTLDSENLTHYEMKKLQEEDQANFYLAAHGFKKWLRMYIRKRSKPLVAYFHNKYQITRRLFQRFRSLTKYNYNTRDVQRRAWLRHALHHWIHKLNSVKEKQAMKMFVQQYWYYMATKRALKKLQNWRIQRFRRELTLNADQFHALRQTSYAMLYWKSLLGFRKDLEYQEKEKKRLQKAITKGTKLPYDPYASVAKQRDPNLRKLYYRSEEDSNHDNGKKMAEEFKIGYEPQQSRLELHSPVNPLRTTLDREKIKSRKGQPFERQDNTYHKAKALMKRTIIKIPE